MRILWLKSELLHPVDRGGRIRTYQMLRQLRREHDITYLALDDGEAGPAEVASAEEYCNRLVRIPTRRLRRGTRRFDAAAVTSLLSALPFVLWRARSAEMRAVIEREATPASTDVLVCDFLLPAVNLPARLGVASVLFQHNVEAVIWKRHVEHARGLASKWFLNTQWRRMRRAEEAICRRFDRVVAVSEPDRRSFEADYGLGNTVSVPTGVDTGYFRPAGKGPRRPRSLVFTGAMDWLPNEDGMRYFVEEILPLLRREVLDAHLTIVGRAPTAAVRDLAARGEGIVVTGSVADVRPYLEEASVFVVPLRIGGGTRLKIFEAMAMELPVVSTTVGAEGLSLTDGSDIVLQDDPPAFAAALARLLLNPEEARRLGRHGATVVRSRFSWEVVSRNFAERCREAMDAHRGGTGFGPQARSGA